MNLRLEIINIANDYWESSTAKLNVLRKYIQSNLQNLDEEWA